jgi:protoheme IX farnesyltransferase
MKTAAAWTPPPLAVARSTALSGLRTKAVALVVLTKPRIVVMVLATVAVGFFLGARTSAYPSTVILTLLGTGLVAAGASVWNQYLERARDALMRRTASRPLPQGLVSGPEAVAFGSTLAVAGLVLLAAGPYPVAAAVALVTFLLYSFAYTLLKPVTTLNTAIGAIPGALPPVIGWSAATGSLGAEAWTLFAIVFLWQFPHFLAIAWLYRDDYARAGHRMLPSVDDAAGSMTGRQAAGHALALLPVGLLPTTVGVAGPIYFLGALALGFFYLAAAARFWFHVSDRSARRLLRASFVYLLAILLLLVLNPLPA